MQDIVKSNGTETPCLPASHAKVETSRNARTNETKPPMISQQNEAAHDIAQE